MIHQELSGKSLYYPCYPFNPWFFSDFQKIGVSFAAKE